MIDAKIINSFLQGINSTCAAIFGENIKIGKLFIKTSEFTSNEVLLFVGITGDYKGQSVISMKVQTAIEIAQKMMGGFSMELSQDLDDISRSALSELSNMIMGSCSSFMSQNNVFIDITPPTLMVGQGLNLNNSKDFHNISVPIEINNCEIEFSVFLKDKK